MIKLGKAWLRINIAYRILFCRYNHFYVVNLDEQNFVKLITEEKEIKMEINFVGMQPYNVTMSALYMANAKDEIDIACERAEYMADTNADIFLSDKR